MVVPSLTFADSHSKDCQVRSSDDTALKAALEKHNYDATCFVTPASIDSNSKGGRHGNNYCNRDSKGSASCNHGTGVIKEPQSNVGECGIYDVKEGKPKCNEDEFGHRENDAMRTEPATEFTSRGQDMGTVLQPMESIAYGSINAVCAPKGKRVQWNDNHGKELVHIFEYAVSDTGDSEEDEDDADTTCACTIQ